METDVDLARLIESARTFTAYGEGAFDYVRDGPVALAAVPDALVTARTYEDGPTRFYGAVHDRAGRLLPGTRGFSEGEFTPLDPDEIGPERRAGALHIRRAVYGGTLHTVLGHFLFETVARLWHGMDFKGRRRIGRGGFPIVLHPWPGTDLAETFGNPLYRAVLEALGIRRRDILLAHEDIVVDTLYDPTPLSVYHTSLHPMMGPLLDHVAARVRTSPLPALALLRRKAPSSRIFLSRSRWAMHRRVSNEPALEALFAAHGFAILHPQRMAPAELVEALQEAACVASTDGSQAHLMAFCRPGTRAVLIDTRPVPTQFALEKLRGLRALHIPVYTNGLWDEADGGIEIERGLDRLLEAVLAPDFALTP